MRKLHVAPPDLEGIPRQRQGPSWREQAASRISKATFVLNGDVRWRGIFHYEHGYCPGGVKDTKVQLYAALLEAGFLLPPGGQQLPPSSRNFQ
jgi:hypothetical protein